MTVGWPGLKGGEATMLWIAGKLLPKYSHGVDSLSILSRSVSPKQREKFFFILLVLPTPRCRRKPSVLTDGELVESSIDSTDLRQH
jgi:hypothetical protein